MNILVVDDELGSATPHAHPASRGTHAARCQRRRVRLERLVEAPADLIICDVRMPGPRWARVPRQVQGDKWHGARHHDERIWRRRGGARSDRRGAYDFILKPFRADQVLLVVRKAIEREGLRREVAQLHDEIARAALTRRGSWAQSTTPRALTLADSVARHPSTVLITGERHGKDYRAAHPRREPARGAGRSSP
jgi:two-component system response regulator AtoC